MAGFTKLQFVDSVRQVALWAGPDEDERLLEPVDVHNL